MGRVTRGIFKTSIDPLHPSGKIMIRSTFMTLFYKNPG